MDCCGIQVPGEMTESCQKTNEKCCQKKKTQQKEWVAFTDHARNVSLNLCQGFPDFSCPQYLKECLSKAALSDDPAVHQYPRSTGHPRLVNALAKLYTPLFGREVDGMSEIVITIGALGALHCCLGGLLSPGDEVIIIEPFFAFYSTMINNVGAVPVYVALKPPENPTGVVHSNDFRLDPEELASKFNSKTKMIIFNTPNNPLGKVYNREETQMVADLCKKNDVICIADEVYEWLIYGEQSHIRMASLPGMWERTITLGSAGKVFTVTGWKIGWCAGPSDLMADCAAVGKATWGTCTGIVQEALADGFEYEMKRFGTPECYFNSLAKEMAPKRHVLASTLREVGLKPIIPDGGYFVVCDITEALGFKQNGEQNEESLKNFSAWIAKTKSIAVMPGCIFYGPEHQDIGARYARFCFFKKDSTLEQCAALVEEWKKAEAPKS